MYEQDLEKLDLLAAELKSKGLDGIEAIYTSFSVSDQEGLRSIAQKHNLLICAGTDFHGSNGPGSPSYAIEMPRNEWIQFRGAFFSSPTMAASISRIQFQHHFRSLLLTAGVKNHATLAGVILPCAFFCQPLLPSCFFWLSSGV
jgi:hypothetical protein